MNRRKKINDTLRKKAKKAHAKQHPNTTKPRYVSKAEREKLEAETTEKNSESNTES